MSVSRIPFRKKIALNLFRKYRINESKVHQLSYIFWECTLKCNLNCLHCGSDCSSISSIKDMPSADFISALDQISPIISPKTTTIVLTGGEPLLRKDIDEIGRQLYSRGFPWGLVTNGMLLDENKLKNLLNCGLRAITVSLDGMEESHNWLRKNRYSYANAMNAIRLLSKYPDLNYDVVTCVNSVNFNELDQIRNLLIQAGITDWRIFTISPIGRAKENVLLKLSPPRFRELFEFIKQTRKENRIKLNYGCEGFLGNYEGEVRDSFFQCKAGINIASVLADGSIAACPNLRGNFVQGNIYKDNFAQVWEEQYSRFRDKSWTKVGICAECDSYKYCEGNGMHLRNENSGELMFCHLELLKEAESPC